ncbi:MAG: metallopeptidase family protein [Chloroflexi bacterium]|jgi:predicted Zn-dependent protease with MMP-like domain|nr:metallopeptidase family protein [Chloroflexota bacterium]
MKTEKFEILIARAIDSLPPEFRHKLENVDIVIQDWPTPRQLRQVKLADRRQLLGLYEGVPQTKRGRSYGMVLPDKISIFQKPIETQCNSEKEVEVRIGEAVRHELAHHFGLDERTLRRIERRRRPLQGRS